MRILCWLGWHRWEITKWTRFKHAKKGRGYGIEEEGFNRTCQRCERVQQLAKPDEYHPTAYVWTDINQITNQ